MSTTAIGQLPPVELFGEVGGRAVVACAPTAGSEVERVASEWGVPVRVVGTAGGGTLLGVELQRLRSAGAAARSTADVCSRRTRLR